MSVGRDTDVAAETDALESQARLSGLSEQQIRAFGEDVRALMDALVLTAQDAAATGMTMDVKKVLETRDYRVTLELNSDVRTGKKTGPLSWLLGK